MAGNSLRPLADEERRMLEEISLEPVEHSRRANRAMTILMLAERQPFNVIKQRLNIGSHTVTNRMRRFNESGIESIMFDKPRNGFHRRR